jgi:DNA-binding transcriptional regulator YhcF (GntR family)
MPKHITSEQIALIRKKSDTLSPKELAFKMGLSVTTVKRYHKKAEKEVAVVSKRVKDDFVYPDDEDDYTFRKKAFVRPLAVYDQSPSPYGIANKLLGIKLTTRCYFKP